MSDYPYRTLTCTTDITQSSGIKIWSWRLGARNFTSGVN